MLGPIRITYSGPTPRAMAKKRNDIQRQAFVAPGKLWHAKFRPTHFTHEGARKYHYTARKGQNLARGSSRFKRSYVGRKLRAVGHDLPLVYTRISKTLTEFQDIRTTPKRMRVVIHAPGFNRKHPKSRIVMRDELTTVAPDEEREMTRSFEVGLLRRFNRIQDRQTVIV